MWPIWRSCAPELSSHYSSASLYSSEAYHLLLKRLWSSRTSNLCKVELHPARERLNLSALKCWKDRDVLRSVQSHHAGTFYRTSTSPNSVLEKIYRGSGRRWVAERRLFLKWTWDETGPDIKYTCRCRKVSWISTHFVAFVDLKGYAWTRLSSSLSDMLFDQR